MDDEELLEIMIMHEHQPWMVYREWEEIGGYVTADMASDACEPSMEGMPIPETVGDWVPYDGVPRIIAALKASKQELAEMTDRKDEYRRLNTELREHLDASKQQLAEAEHEKQCTEHLMTSPTDRWDELAEWLDKTGYINESFLVRCYRDSVDLRAQLAEAEEWRGVWKDRCLFGVTKLREYKEQLAASQAEVKRLGYENRVIRAAHDVPNGLSIIVPGAEKDEG